MLRKVKKSHSPSLFYNKLGLLLLLVYLLLVFPSSYFSYLKARGTPHMGGGSTAPRIEAHLANPA